MHDFVFLFDQNIEEKMQFIYFYLLYFSNSHLLENDNLTVKKELKTGNCINNFFFRIAVRKMQSLIVRK